MSKILILGANGMLGAYVYRYFDEKNHYVTGTTRKHFEATKHGIDRSYVYNLVKQYDLVVNCIGVIKPQIEKNSVSDVLLINSVFPHLLAEMCEKSGTKLIHVTTDCVFADGQGHYDEDCPHSAQDLYGKSKSLGEPKNCTVIRTSIIGEEKSNKRSLLEWAKSNAGKECNGYLNHWWNGITCLQLAKIIDQIQSENLFWNGTRHVFSPEDITKLTLLQYIDFAYGLGLKVNGISSGVYCDRTLRTKFEENSKFNIPDLPRQLQELSKFKL